jgi:hypothetical protein
LAKKLSAFPIQASSPSSSSSSSSLFFHSKDDYPLRLPSIHPAAVRQRR